MAKWGTHALAAAAKRLVEAAVLDQLNQWFVLVGDTTGAAVQDHGCSWLCEYVSGVSAWA